MLYGGCVCVCVCACVSLMLRDSHSSLGEGEDKWHNYQDDSNSCACLNVCVCVCGAAREGIKFGGKSCFRSTHTHVHTHTHTHTHTHIISPVTAILLTNTNKNAHTPPRRKAGDSNPSQRWHHSLPVIKKRKKKKLNKGVPTSPPSYTQREVRERAVLGWVTH